MQVETKRGFAYPYGATQTSEGVNFNLYAPYATSIKLHLFDNERAPIDIYTLQPSKNKTGAIWHIHIRNVALPVLYGWEVHNQNNLLLDPFAKEIDSSPNWKSGPYQPLSKLSKTSYFDWKEDVPPRIPKKDLIIYEMHVRGFTNDLSSEVKHPGTFSALKEKIPYLKELGINAVELLPIFEFNELEYPLLCNYWGYSTVNYFSPTNRYGKSAELKEFVKAAHHDGIEVFLDVVFNHTAEGDLNGPIYSFKGLDPATFYQTHDYTGCGNTLNTNHPFVREWILASLRHWVQEYHIDGFRFDLASIFYRGEHGNILSHPPIVEEITKDPILKHTKLIAEAWDAGGLYQVGAFYSHSNRWLEWNGLYRDTVRRFIRGDIGEKGNFATRITGSQDLFFDRTPQNSINFVDCHDGFTLRDLVSYNEKHNFNNGEHNRDGTNQNESWNCGHEGPTSDDEINALRLKQMKNFMVALFISQGIPMFTSGDEYGHTKEGNNNTWCQDNRLNWFLWDILEKETTFYQFTKGLIHLRKSYPHFRKTHFLTENDIHWYGTTSDRPQWNFDNHFVGFLLKDENDPLSFYIAFNASNKKLTITLPQSEHAWQWVVNTASEPPFDFFSQNFGPLLLPHTYTLAPYSAIILKETPKL